MKNMDTDDFIRRLSADAKPVERLAHPMLRAGLWFGGSLIYGGLIAFLIGFRPDLSAKSVEPIFLIEVGAAVLTSMMASAAAFCAGCPGRPLWERFAPMPFLLVWLGVLCTGCWLDYIRVGAAGLALQLDVVCLPLIAAISILPGAAILLMIWAGAPIAPISTAALAALAATALAAAILRLTHELDMRIMLLVWQFGSAMAIALFVGAFGRKLLRWPLKLQLVRP